MDVDQPGQERDVAEVVDAVGLADVARQRPRRDDGADAAVGDEDRVVGQPGGQAGIGDAPGDEHQGIGHGDPPSRLVQSRPARPAARASAVSRPHVSSSTGIPSRRRRCAVRYSTSPG